MATPQGLEPGQSVPLVPHESPKPKTGRLTAVKKELYSVEDQFEDALENQASGFTYDWDAFQSICTNTLHRRTVERLGASVGGSLDLYEADSLKVAADELKANVIDCKCGVCMIKALDEGKTYVMYRSDVQKEVFKKCNVHQLSRPARLHAAKTIMLQTSKLELAAVMFYRFVEFFANVIMLALFSWVVHPVLVLLLFVLLFFIPASIHCGSFLTVMTYFLLNFAADDFSFLRLCPAPRNARKLYTCAVLRVFIMLVLFCTLAPVFPGVPRLPSAIAGHIRHQKSIERMQVQAEEIDSYGNESGIVGVLHAVEDVNKDEVIARVGNIAFDVAIGITITTVISSVVYIVITLHMLCVKKCAKHHSPLSGLRNAKSIQLIDELAFEIESIISGTLRNPKECHQKLLDLQESNPAAHGLHMAKFPQVWGQVIGAIVHCVVDLLNAYNFAKHEDYVRSVCMVLCVLFTCGFVSMRGGIRNVYKECMLSWKRGIMTDGYLDVMRADKGMQSVPALLVILSGLPWNPGGAKTIIAAVGSVVMNLATIVPFIFEQFDLGVEREGDDLTHLLHVNFGLADSSSDSDDESSTGGGS